MSEETPRLAEYVEAITRTFVGTPYTLLEIAKLLMEEGFRKKTVEPFSDFWMDYENMRPQERRAEYRSTLTRIRSLTDNRILRFIVGQQNTLDFREIMDSGKILLVK